MMMRKSGIYLFVKSIVILLPVLIMMASCSLFQKGKSDLSAPGGTIVKKTDEDIKRDRTEIKSIIGSAEIGDYSKHPRKTYFLYGAEHLKLDNYYFDIPVVYNKSVKKWMNYFLNRGRGVFSRYSARAGRYAPLIGKILEVHGLPRDLIFLSMAESGFHNKARSWAGAVGPWQFMPYTGKKFGLRIDWHIDERRDPIKATIAACRFLKQLYEKFGSWELAGAAYNAGPGKMSRAIRRYKTENFWSIRRGRYLKSETKNYIPKIMALAIIGKNLRAFGFKEIVFHEPLNFEEIDIPEMTDLYKVSEILGVDFEELHALNPEIRRWYSSPDLPNYKLRVPVGTSAKWGIRKPADILATRFQSYKLRGRRSTLSDVAKKFKVKPSVLKMLNPNLSSKRRLKRGTSVALPFRIAQSRKASMYADLYYRPRKSVRNRRKYRSRIKLAQRRGRKIASPRGYYTVQRGDTLWDVARKNSISLDTLILSNLRLVKRRMIRAGDKLVVR